MTKKTLLAFLFITASSAYSAETNATQNTDSLFTLEFVTSLLDPYAEKETELTEEQTLRFKKNYIPIIHACDQSELSLTLNQMGIDLVAMLPATKVLSLLNANDLETWKAALIEAKTSLLNPEGAGSSIISNLFARFADKWTEDAISYYNNPSSADTADMNNSGSDSDN